MRLKPDRCGGFTLIELLVVMVLISIVTAFTIPSIRTNVFSDQLKAAARRLVGFVNEVSQSAVSSRASYIVSIDLDENLLTAQPGATTKTGSDDDDVRKMRLTLPESVEIADVAVLNGDTYTQGALKLKITDKGYVVKTAIHLRDDDGRDMTVVLSSFLGVIRVFDSYVDLADERARY